MLTKSFTDDLSWLLISPYWNVNLYTATEIANALHLLISPYWNVNSMLLVLGVILACTFNLSILECK